MSFKSWYRQGRRFFDEYTDGVDPRQIHRVLGRDATRAFDVLTRDQPGPQKKKGSFATFWDRTRRLFLGMSGKLSPPRRVLFGACMVVALLGLQSHDVVIGAEELRIISSPLLLLVSIAGLVLLLVLELADRVVVRDELEVARQLQAELMAEREPAIDGWTFTFSYSTANTIGGDYYEFVPLSDGRLLVATGDASGHGIAAGLLMAVANAALKLAADRDPDPASIVATVNGALYRTGGPRAFMTLFCAVLEPDTGRLTYVCAGHPFPLLRRADQSIEELGKGALPAGIRPTLSLETASVVMERGDTLVMYSDGIPERLNAAQNAYGFDRVRSAVRTGGGAQQIHDRILAEVRAFSGGEPAHDDQSLVVMMRES